METNTQEYIQGIVESLVFISEKPVNLEQMKESIDIVGIGIPEIRRSIEQLKQEYEEKKRGMVIVEIAGGYQMLSSPDYASYVRTFLKTHVKERLSKPSLETLAIIAYKQPISRAEVEFIRGVNSDGVITHLLDKELVKIVGRKEIPGRPYIYGTTKQFLEYFGLKSLEDLPKLETLLSLIPQMPAEMEQKLQLENSPSQESSQSENTGESSPREEIREINGEEVVAAENRLLEIIADENPPLVETEQELEKQIESSGNAALE